MYRQSVYIGILRDTSCNCGDTWKELFYSVMRCMHTFDVNSGCFYVQPAMWSVMLAHLNCKSPSPSSVIKTHQNLPAQSISAFPNFPPFRLANRNHPRLSNPDGSRPLHQSPSSSICHTSQITSFKNVGNNSPASAA